MEYFSCRGVGCEVNFWKDFLRFSPNASIFTKNTLVSSWLLSAGKKMAPGLIRDLSPEKPNNRNELCVWRPHRTVGEPGCRATRFSLSDPCNSVIQKAEFWFHQLVSERFASCALWLYLDLPSALTHSVLRLWNWLKLCSCSDVIFFFFTIA